jgi:hypothetical protein
MPEALQASFDHQGLIRDLLAQARHASLGTLTEAGAPFASLVALALDADFRPVIITSHLSGHTGHMERDPRVALLVSDVGKGDPLAHPRLTLTGVARDARPGQPLYEELRGIYLARHPKAALYVELPGFWFWRIEPQSVALNGGFGKAWSGPWSALSFGD